MLVRKFDKPAVCNHSGLTVADLPYARMLPKKSGRYIIAPDAPFSGAHHCLLSCLVRWEA